MAKRIVTKIGDVFCVEVDNEYKRYFQYFCNDMTQLNSSVIRVFKKSYPMDYNPILEDIVSDDVDFYVHTILREGIEFGFWYKTGKKIIDFTKDIQFPTFGICPPAKKSDNNRTGIDLNSNWYIWKINQAFIKIESLLETTMDNFELGGVMPSIEIINRIKFGYYRWTSSAYDFVRRYPHAYTNSYVRRVLEKTTQYLHFVGEDVVQKMEVNNDGRVFIEEGHPLSLPKFWETNWKYSEFITKEEFESVWNKYSSE